MGLFGKNRNFWFMDLPDLGLIVVYPELVEGLEWGVFAVEVRRGGSPFRRMGGVLSPQMSLTDADFLAGAGGIEFTVVSGTPFPASDCLCVLRLSLLMKRASSQPLPCPHLRTAFIAFESSITFLLKRHSPIEYEPNRHTMSKVEAEEQVDLWIRIHCRTTSNHGKVARKAGRDGVAHTHWPSRTSASIIRVNPRNPAAKKAVRLL